MTSTVSTELLRHPTESCDRWEQIIDPPLSAPLLLRYNCFVHALSSVDDPVDLIVWTLEQIAWRSW
jgi:hypothetical protein